VLEVDDAPHRATVLDVHPGLELVRADDVGHPAAQDTCHRAANRLPSTHGNRWSGEA
jgi:hypothetical protein